jgi:Mg2+/Co2+ transporter CorB
MPTVFVFILFILLAILSFFLSASETSVIALSKIRLRHMVIKGIKKAQSIQRLVTKMDKFIAAILIGNNFVNIAMSAIVTAICVPIFGFNWGVVISTFATSFFVLTFCEITPKILATKHTEKIALFAAPIMEALTKILSPIIWLFINMSNAILRLLRIGPSKRSPLITEEELRLMIEVGKEEGVLSDEERSMLHRIFEFGDTKVSDVMIPKEKITAININFTSEQLLNVFVEEGHARLPVYSGTIDNIVGIIYARDLLYILREKGLFLLQDIMHEAYFVPAAMRVNELLEKFQAGKIQIAIVVDDHKKTLGLVTLEDLIEEIIGEIEERQATNIINKN